MGKTYIHFGGIKVPAVTGGNRETTMITTSQGKKRPATFVDTISLREPNPNGAFAGNPAYLRFTRENVEFMTTRTETVPGLDVDASTGELLSYAQIDAIRGEQISARQLERAEAQAPASGSLEDLATIAAD